MDVKNVFVDPFNSNVQFPYPPKKSEYQRLSDIFRE